MANVLKINPATDGSNDSKSMERVAAVLNDAKGDDVNINNPLPVMGTQESLELMNELNHNLRIIISHLEIINGDKIHTDDLEES